MHPLIPDYNSPGQLSGFLESRGLGMRKRYGQNFLINPGIRRSLLDALEIKEGENIWEIGCGLGAMTEGLLERGAKVTGFEIDPGFINILKELFGSNRNFNLVEGDVLKTWPMAARDSIHNTAPDKLPGLLGNLPYNIAAVLLADFIEKKQLFKKMVITVQLETAQRLTALPGTRDYSSISVLCSAVYKISPLMIIKGPSFYPVPRVNSRGLRFDLRNDREEAPDIFYSLLRSLFSSRRKTIQNNLSSFISSVIINNNKAGKTESVQAIVSGAFRQTGISGSRRAETLETGEFISLARVLEDLLKHDR